MGNGASIEFERLQANRLFCNEGLKLAVGKLCNDPEERISFTTFVKEGVWMDDICLNANFQTSRKALMASESSLQLLCGYIVPQHLYLNPDITINSPSKKDDHLGEDEVVVEESGKTVNSRTSSPRHAFCESEKSATDSTKTVELLTSGVASAWIGTKSTNSLKKSSVRDFHADYARLESQASGNTFSKFQLLYFLFAILYPLYEAHRHSDGSAKESASMVCFMDHEGQCRCAVPCREPVLSAEASKAQELLLAAAAHHDEERMLLLLSTPDWLQQMQRAFHECPLGISVCDARNGTGFPILYANSALQQMTGYAAKHLIGRTFHLLQGPDTEPEQVQRMSNTLKARESTRVVLTNYRKNGTKFVNMLALRPVFNQAGEYCYVLGVSFDVSRRGASLSELQQVDTIVALLPLVITS